MFISFTAKKAQRECLSIFMFTSANTFIDIYSIAVPLVIKIDDYNADMAIN